jgi:DNA polymerase (family 10)
VKEGAHGGTMGSPVLSAISSLGMATTLPRNADVADQLDLLADLSEIRGDDSFRVSAYRRAATRVRETSAPVAELALSGRAKELQGIGKTIEEKIVEIVQDGEIHALTRRKAEVPGDIVLFMRLPGLGPKSAKKIWQELGITTLEQLREAAEAHRLRALPGMGAKTEENVLRALAAPAAAEEPRRALLGRALPALEAVVAVLAEHPAADQVSIAGSARRYRETVRDLDIIATATDAAALIDYFTTLRWVVDIAAKGPTKATVVSQDGYRFDLRVVPPECYGNLLQHFTGSKDHNVALREAAVRRKLSVSEYGVENTETGEVFTARTEDELYRFLGYDFIPPELRENSGELEAARKGELPQLVEVRDLRGDLHTHTHWSADGKNTLEEMVRAAIARGYEYYAITDHSHYLREGRLEAQADEIAALQEEVAPFRILRGVEVNIKADGTLDLPDEQLATLDWVVASVHAARQKNPLERVFAAMENTYVDCIGHLTGRKLNKRGPVEIDLERVFEKALETKTFLELNSQPDRLDLRDVHARAAREAGLKLVVDSDGHEIGAQDYVEFGVGQARRAWLTKADVVNTRTWKQIERIRKPRPST